MGLFKTSRSNGGAQCSVALTIALSAALSYTLLRVGYVDNSMRAHIASSYSGREYDSEIHHFNFQYSLGVTLTIGSIFLAIYHVISFFFLRFLQWGIYLAALIWSFVLAVECGFSYEYMSSYRALLLGSSESVPIVSPEWHPILTTAGGYGWFTGILSSTALLMHLCMGGFTDAYKSAAPGLYFPSFFFLYASLNTIVIGTFNHMTGLAITTWFAVAASIIILYVTKCLPQFCQKFVRCALFIVIGIIGLSFALESAIFLSEMRGKYLFTTYRPSFVWNSETSVDTTDDSRFVEQRFGTGYLYSSAMALSGAIGFLLCAFHAVLSVFTTDPNEK